MHQLKHKEEWNLIRDLIENCDTDNSYKMYEADAFKALFAKTLLVKEG